MSEVLPEYYGDIYYVRTNQWGVAITFAVSSPKEGVNEHDVCIVRLSHEAAKVLAMLIRKQLKHYEKDNDTLVGIPSETMKSLDLPPGDW
jgi:hypothetical protein